MDHNTSNFNLFLYDMDGDDKPSCCCQDYNIHFERESNERNGYRLTVGFDEFAGDDTIHLT